MKIDYKKLESINNLEQIKDLAKKERFLYLTESKKVIPARIAINWSFKFVSELVENGTLKIIPKSKLISYEN